MLKRAIIRIITGSVIGTGIFVSTLPITGTTILTSRAYAAVVTATDPLIEKQTYLQQIHIQDAWGVATGNNNLIIAMVDTGVDLTHPDLLPNLVDGTNLLHPDELPLDDNGHGTNVAGVMAAAANNDRGGTGILWNAKLMPIKALEADGTGGEAKLGEGIKYAVDHGAKIVVLSLGLNKYSTYLSDIVQYAEDHDVLLVAATGNEGNRVKYPAAYPTVLAVGGMTADKKTDSRSNTGPELDLVAPWDVFTTSLGGGYEYKDGTSMAAPQVAAVAALAWSKYPSMKPYEIRNLLRQKTEPLSGSGWNPTSGYGLLRADWVMNELYSEDMYEPNDRKDQASPISASKMISATFQGGGDADWYSFNAPYNGNVNLILQTEEGYEVTVNHIQTSGAAQSYTFQAGGKITLPVSKGTNYIQLQLKDRTFTGKLAYRLTTSFDIYKDEFEDNDRQYSAYVLPMRSQTITGTLHQMNDQDWFMLPVEQSGFLRLKLSVDTARIDPVLYVQKQGEKGVTYDLGGDGAAEVMPKTAVFPGNYYIRVSNVKEYTFPVTGEYKLTVEYEAHLIDPNEPNDKPYQATAIKPGASYDGVIESVTDQDWFLLKINSESFADLHLSGIPENVRLTMTVYDSNLKQLATATNTPGATTTDLSGRWQAGSYYMKLTSDKPFDYQMYSLTADVTPLLGGFTDIAGHWAADDILAAVKSNLIEGYSGYKFMPDRTITRAEAAAILVRGFKLTKQKYIGYTDLGANHWAYSFIAKAAQAGIVEGYPDQSFAPDSPVTRMEMTAMMARAMKLSGKQRGAAPFTDTDDNYWGTGVLKQMKAEGWASGFPDGSFRPEQPATRAEFVTMLEDILN